MEQKCTKHEIKIDALDYIKIIITVHQKTTLSV